MNNDLGEEIEQRIKRQQEEALNLHKKVLNERFQKKKAELEKNYTEKAKQLETQYSGSKRLMQALRVVAIISILAIIVAIGAISQNRAIRKAKALQAQIQEVNTADWYLCGKDLTVYTRNVGLGAKPRKRVKGQVPCRGLRGQTAPHPRRA